MKEEKGNRSPDSADGGAAQEEEGRSAHSAVGSSPLRVVVLVLLLVAAAAAGLLSYLGQMQPVGAPATGAEKHRIAIPKQGTPEGAPPQEKIETVRIEAPPIPAAASPEGGSPSTPPPAEKTPSQPTPFPPPSSDAPAEQPGKRVTAGGGFTLETGPLVVAAEVAGAEKALQRLGFEPRRTSARQEVTLIRLLQGVYPPAEAKEKLAELSRVAPSAFALPRGDEVAVFVGTYYDIDKARAFADQLYGQGISLVEEQAQVTIKVQRLRFGSFSDRAAAERAAQKAAAAGIETSLVRQR